jgi:hypothetical protein
MKEPTIAVAVLHLFCRDEALVGDILEEYETRRSRAWLWRQVGAAVTFNLPYGTVRHERRSPTMRMPIGGLTFVILVSLVTIVAPGAWWLVAIGAAGGVVLAVVLVAVARRRLLHEPPGTKNVLLR